MEKLEMLEAILDSYPYRVVFVDCDHVIRYLTGPPNTTTTRCGGTGI